MRERVSVHPGWHLCVTTLRRHAGWLGLMNYEIRVEGVLDPCWSAWFDGLQMSSERDGVTVIAGIVTDQAALHSALAKISDIGLSLISVQRIEPDLSEGASGPGGGRA
jgi:hypothetical protein